MALTIKTVDYGEDYITASVSTSGSVAMQHNWYIDGDLYKSVQTAAGVTTSTCSFTDLEPGTRYTIKVEVYAFNPWRMLDSGSKSITTDSSFTTYYAKLILDGNGGTLNNGATTVTYTGTGQSLSSYAWVEISYNCSFVREGYTFLGYSEDPYAMTADYAKSDVYEVYSNKTSSSNPAVGYLYAVWVSARPANWSWSSNVSSGAAVTLTKISDTEYEAVYLTAEEWNEFIDRIVAFLVYCGKVVSNASSAYVTKGTPMTKDQVNLVRSIIEVMNPPTALPSAATDNGRITAAFINGLKDSLNSIT